MLLFPKQTQVNGEGVRDVLSPAALDFHWQSRAHHFQDRPLTWASRVNLLSAEQPQLLRSLTYLMKLESASLQP